MRLGKALICRSAGKSVNHRHHDSASSPPTVESEETPARRHCSQSLAVIQSTSARLPSKPTMRRISPPSGRRRWAILRGGPAINSTATGSVCESFNAASNRSADARSRRSQAAKADVSGTGRTSSVTWVTTAERAQRAGHEAAEVVSGGVFHHPAAGGESDASAVHGAESQEVVRGWPRVRSIAAPWR